MSLLPPDYPKAIVAIGVNDREGTFGAYATGFLVGIERDEEETEIFLVTNRHVFSRKKSVVIRFDDRKITLPLRNNEGPIWVNHKKRNVDIAVVSIPDEELERLELSITYYPESSLATTDKMIEELEIDMGDEVFVLGFPMGIAGEEKNYPIVRSGIIARMDDEILENSHYYIDTAIYGGNSGGPVILKPRHLCGEEPPLINTPYIIGVVSAVKLDRQTLYGVRDGVYEPRMDIYQNANLGVVVPIEYVLETIELLKKKRLEQLSEDK